MDLEIEWGSLVLVLGVAFITTVAVVVLYSVGLRLLSLGDPQSGTARPVAASVAAWTLIGICGAVVLYGVYLVIPQFH
ncbi:hypothetical protein [Orlajensenia leifsoniae]|nr:hypothetical protein [Leifsonia flava]